METFTTTPVVTTPGPCDIVPTTTMPTTVTTTPAATFTTTPVVTTPGPCDVVPAKLYADNQKNAQTNVVNGAASALPAWFLPISGVFGLAAGVAVVGKAMHRRQGARVTRTFQTPSSESDEAATDEEPFLAADVSEV